MFAHKRKPFEKRFDRKASGNGVITTLFKKGLTANLLRKGLIENGGINFKRLIPKPYRRDQPAQRLRCNGCSTTVAAQRLWRMRWIK
jgi:hypothetical protein